MQSNVHSAISWLRAQPLLAMGTLRDRPVKGVAGRMGGPARLQQDSRAVRPGDIFVAMPGGTHDGRAFIGKAIEQGASAVLWDSSEFSWPAVQGVKQLGIAGLKQQAGEIAAQWYGRPSEQLHVFAYTGTSGKTSCSTWTSQLLSALGKSCAVIGTRGAGIGDALQPVGLTTPQALEMQWLFAQFQDQGAQAVAIEASSIGIEEGRLNGTQVRTALFTNLSRDHLDYHGDMAAYAASKARLFAWSGLKTAVINIDDPAADQMIAKVPVGVQKIFVSLRKFSGITKNDSAQNLQSELNATSASKARHLFADQIRFETDGMRFVIGGDFGTAQVHTKVAGLFNISNLLMVAACALVEGFTLNQIVSPLSQLQAIEGRMQMFGGRVGDQQLPVVVVDYAHKPDALEKVLESLRPQAQAGGGQLWCVFGCGGDRDAGKRPLMGAIAQRLSDRPLVTSDNPRTEDPSAIAQHITLGMNHGSFEVELDRAKAIASVVQRAKNNDVILIAGKGHEAYQEIGSQRIDFSDAIHVETALAKKLKVH
jgi:UDP-N-acetylmuramoyl-L-alanyl-D-glutamate--2,6-diaminopimelate ligase